MLTITRRGLLLGTAATFGAGLLTTRREARAGSGQPPRRLVIAMAEGGWDTTAVLDPKPGLADIVPGPESSFPGNFVEMGGQAYFTAFNEADGSEIYRTDGSAATLAGPLIPGDGGSVYGLKVIDGVIYFSAYTPENGSEPWLFDGTSAYMVRDVLPGPEGSIPVAFTKLGDSVIFGADDGIHGGEPWVIHPDREVKLRLLGSRAGVSRKGYAALRLSCPASEPNGPCVSKITVTTRKPVRVGKKRRRVMLSKKSIQVIAGNTGTARITFSRKHIGLLSRSSAARKVLVRIRVNDYAGNRQTISRKFKLGRPA